MSDWFADEDIKSFLKQFSIEKGKKKKKKERGITKLLPEDELSNKVFVFHEKFALRLHGHEERKTQLLSGQSNGVSSRRIIIICKNRNPIVQLHSTDVKFNPKRRVCLINVFGINLNLVARYSRWCSIMLAPRVPRRFVQ